MKYVLLLALTAPLAAQAIGFVAPIVASRGHVQARPCDEACQKERELRKAKREEEMRKRAEVIATPSNPKPAIEEKKKMQEKLKEVNILKQE